MLILSYFYQIGASSIPRCLRSVPPLSPLVPILWQNCSVLSAICTCAWDELIRSTFIRIDFGSFDLRFEETSAFLLLEISRIVPEWYFFREMWTDLSVTQTRMNTSVGAANIITRASEVSRLHEALGECESRPGERLAASPVLPPPPRPVGKGASQEAEKYLFWLNLFWKSITTSTSRARHFHEENVFFPIEGRTWHHRARIASK